MSASVAKSRPPLPFGGIFDLLVEVMGLATASDVRATKAANSARGPSSPATAFVNQVWLLAGLVLEAQDRRALRQTLGRLALSVEFAEVLVDGATATKDLSAPEIKNFRTAIQTGRVAEVLKRQLGDVAASMLAQAFDLASEIAEWMCSDQARAGNNRPISDLLSRVDPSELSRLRHVLVLGDKLPADIAEVVLASMRGEVAVLVLLAALLRDERLPQWKGIELAELAVDGLKAQQRLVLPVPERIDIDAEARKYETFKSDLVLRLLHDENE